MAVEVSGGLTNASISWLPARRKSPGRALIKPLGAAHTAWGCGGSMTIRAGAVPVSCFIMCDKEADLAEHAAHRRPSRLRGRAVAVQHTGLGTENRLSEPFSVPLV